MTDVKKLSPPQGYGEDIYCRSRMKVFPDGGREIMYSNKPVFRVGGPRPKAQGAAPGPDAGKGRRSSCDAATTAAGEAARATEAPRAANDDRARRRARAKVRDLALCNRFEWFVTLTLDRSKVDRYDMSAIERRLSRWLDNAVRRRGVRYVLVPERHKDGAIHFHGLMSGNLDFVDSGHKDAQGHPIFNAKAWKMGFSAAIRVYGNYPQAVAYVCKYIGKQGDKPGGRWYFSGGSLRQPEVIYGCCEDWDTMFQIAGALGPLDAEAYTFEIPECGIRFGIVRQNM